MCCHDEDCLRLTGDRRKMKDLKFSEIPQFKKKLPLHFSKQNAAGQYEDFYIRKEGDVSRFTPLKTLFEEIPKHVPINIDFKDEDDDECIRATVKLIETYDRFSTTIVGGS